MKKKFVRNRNGKEEEKELPGPTKSESKSTTKSKGKPNPDVKSQNIENFDKPSASSQECMSSSSEDRIEGLRCLIGNFFKFRLQPLF